MRPVSISVGVYVHTIISNVKGKWWKKLTHLIVYKQRTFHRHVLVLIWVFGIAYATVWHDRIRYDARKAFLKVISGQRFNVRLIVQHYSNHNAIIPNTLNKRHLNKTIPPLSLTLFLSFSSFSDPLTFSLSFFILFVSVASCLYWMSSDTWTYGWTFILSASSHSNFEKAVSIVHNDHVNRYIETNTNSSRFKCTFEVKMYVRLYCLVNRFRCCFCGILFMFCGISINI